jgi:hypothetical protein
MAARGPGANDWYTTALTGCPAPQEARTPPARSSRAGRRGGRRRG